MATWPASLEQRPLRGLTELRQKGTLRSDMDAGPQKVRKRFTSAVRNIDVPVVFTSAQRTTFDTFFITTLGEGSTSFDWAQLQTEIDPSETGTLLFRFKQPAKMTKAAGEWKTVLNLEVLP